MNEVEIGVRIDDETDTGFRSVHTKSQSFTDSIKGMFKRAGDESAKSLANPLIEHANKWNVKIKESEGVVESLRRKIAETGDTSLFGDLSKAETELTKLKKFRDSIVTDMKSAGEESGIGFGLGFSQRVGPLIAKAPIGPHLATAVAAAGPLVSGLLTSSIALGAGAGAVALGAALSAKDPKVSAGIKSLQAFIGSELTQSARPFVPAMLKATDDAKGFIRTIRPELDKAFEKSSTYLDPLLEGGLGFVKNALPGFNKLIDAAEPFVDIWRDELPELGGDFADLMESIATSASRNEGVFRLTLDTVGLIVQQLGAAVEMMDFLGLGPLRQVADWIYDTSDAAEELKDPVEQAAEAFEEQKQAMELATAAALDYLDTLDKIKDQNLNAAEATLNYREELKEAKDAMDGKRKVNEEEAQTLIDLARKSNDLTESLDDQGRSAEQASAHHKRLREDFIRTAMQAGHTRSEASKLADQYLKMPRNVRTTIQANTDEARRRAQEFKNLLASIPRNIKVNVGAGGSVFKGFAHGGIVGSAQDGGIRSGLTMVAEHGREILDLPPGTHVQSNPDTERMLAGGMGSGGIQVIEVRPAPGADEPLMRKIIEGLQFTIGTEGQNDPQTFLKRK